MKILAYTKTYKSNVFSVILFNVLFVIFNLASLLLFIPFLKLIFEGSGDEIPVPPDASMGLKEYWEHWYNYEVYTFVETNGQLTALAYICIAVLFCFFFKNLFRYLAMYKLAYIRNGVVKDLRNTLHTKILHLELGFFSEERKGDLHARTMNDVQEIEVSIMGTLELLFREPLAIILTLILLFALSWELTLFSLILLPVSALIISRIGKSLKRTSAKAQDKLGSLSAALQETLGGIRIIKAFNAEDQIKDNFDDINHRYKTVLTRALRKRDLASPLNEFMGACVMIALVYFGGVIILEENSMSGAAFLGFIIAFSQLLRPIQGVATSISNVNKGLASIDRVNKILNAEVKITDPQHPKKLDSLTHSIEYKNVSFAYHSGEKVLDNINVYLEKGKTLALVGESGGGKSTMADLLPRFYDCLEGGVYIDGVDIRECTLYDLRQMMGIVTQQSILFNDTVKKNIMLGQNNHSDEAVIQAAKIANAHSFIMDMPDGYDTNIGDEGSKLSGGQRQRLSIARAVLKNPDILILDEATSALDTESEKLVQEALEKLMQNRTSIVIAHRLSTIKHADEIVVLQKGKIVERGKHEDLYAANGVYRNLCDLQSFS